MDNLNLFKAEKLYPAPSVQLKTFASLSYARKVSLLIIVLSIVRLVLAFTLELGNDEAYYWLYSQHLQWNYFDHPPMIALWIRIFTANLSFESFEGFIRLGSVLGCALSTWFLYKAVSGLSTERAGWFAACLYNASFYAGITAGLYSMPDSPQMVFWTLCLWMIARITKKETGWINWILFGIAAGLCIMSKVHGIFIWLGLGLYVLFNKRSWLTRPHIYIALLLTATIACPILIWNFEHHFVTYQFHSQRVTIQRLSINTYTFLKELAGQLFFNNVFNVVLIMMGLGAMVRKKIKLPPAVSIYNFIGLPLAILLLFISLFRNTLPHWSGPAYVSLIPLAAIRLAQVNKKSYRPVLLRLSLISFVAVLIGWSLIIQFYPGTFGTNNEKDLGRGDVSLDMHGWTEGGNQFAALYKDETSKGIMPANAPVVCWKWWAAHEDYYFCRPLGLQMIGLGSMNDLHEYMWTNKWRKDKVDFSKAYCIVPSDELYNVHNQYAPFYSRINLVTVIKGLRSKQPSHNFYIFRLTGWKARLPIGD